jgi:hypothetical protein
MVLLVAACPLTTIVRALPVSGTSTFRGQGAPSGCEVAPMDSGAPCRGESASIESAWKFHIYVAGLVSPNPARSDQPPSLAPVDLGHNAKLL